MNKYLIPVFALAIAGYTTAPTDKPAEPQAPLATGLVAVTMQSDDGFTEISFAKINPLTCHVEKTISYEGANYPKGISGDTHLIENFETGTWVIEGTTFIDGHNKTITRFENGALTFNVKEGAFIHLGNLKLSTSGSILSQEVIEHLAHYVAGNPIVRADPSIVEPRITPFSHNSDEPVVGCKSISDDQV
ncbi:MAG: hypothetical protein JKY84_07190 [Emcibacteraceae bacterium]|nr:hypothetical protein [Emcibacteraceae bacterium]